jgi:hypothetical protein
MKTSTNMDRQMIYPTLNPTVVMAALTSLMAIWITKKVMNINNDSAMRMFLFLIIGISLLSLPLWTIMINTQASSGSTSAGTMGSETGASEREGNNLRDEVQKDAPGRQMGICLVGFESPCNSDSNLDRR